METLWFAIVAFMLAMYVVLDGFDLGAGISHLFVARNDEERRTVLRTIGPVWDGNEVWLLAAGGTLYFAFPLLYASSFSGFYLPLIMVLWLLMARGLGIEFRHQLGHPMWKSFWDVVFAVSSILLSIVLGAALGNVVRGVPLDARGYFFEPLWTTFGVGPEPGILDWFTVLMGLVSMFVLTVHGANYVAMKTDGAIQARARKIALIGWLGVLMTSVPALVATSSIRPEIWNNFSTHLWAVVFPVAGVAGLGGMLLFGLKEMDARAFLSSSTFIVGMLGATAFGLYPNVLPSSSDPSLNLTIVNTVAHEYGLSVGLIWWIAGMVLASGYFIFVYRSFRGKVSARDGGY
jgi:cytochrome bd ubiquinol oxidase subunit II